MVAKIVGTPGKPVTFSFAISVSTWPGKVNERSRTRRAPILNAMIIW